MSQPNTQENKPAQPVSYTGCFLIAMPQLKSDIFTQSVIYVIKHLPSGSVGIMINHALPLVFGSILDSLDLPASEKIRQEPVFLGGPMNTETGYFLHEAGYSYRTSMPSGDLVLTSSRDVLEQHALGQGPKNVLISLGYSAWSEGQLEQEIADNAWLTVAADTQIIFNTPVNERYARAIKLLGIDPNALLGDAGHA